jgi:transposase InsO family protein
MLDWTATREVTVMPRKRYTPEEILQHLRTVELDTGKGLAVLDACRKLGITEQTYRVQFLDGELFYTLKEAQIMTERWRRHYNTVRPHGSLRGQPPVPETIQLAS